MIADFLVAVLDLYTVVLVVRIVFSWLPPRSRQSVFYQFLFAITEPLMRPFRRLLPPVSGMDFSPIVLFLLVMVVKSAMKRLL